MSLIRDDDEPAVVLFIALSAVIGLVLVVPLQRPHAAPTPEPVGVTVESGPNLPHEGTARLRITVTPSAENRGLWRAIESDDYAAASFETLTGATAPRTRWVEFRDLPDGTYTAEARLLRDHGELNAHATFTVGGGDDEVFP